MQSGLIVISGEVVPNLYASRLQLAILRGRRLHVTAQTALLLTVGDVTNPQGFCFMSESLE